MIEVIVVGVGGAVGATLRYTIGRALENTPVPWATLLVNVTGSFLLGMVLVGIDDPVVTLFLGAGVCGALTTFSSFSVETVELHDRNGIGFALMNAIGTLALCLVAFGLGTALAA